MLHITSPSPSPPSPSHHTCSHLGAHISSKPLPAFSTFAAAVFPKLGFLLLVQVLPEKKSRGNNFHSSGTKQVTAGGRGKRGTPVEYSCLNSVSSSYPLGNALKEMVLFLFQKVGRLAWGTRQSWGVHRGSIRLPGSKAHVPSPWSSCLQFDGPSTNKGDINLL